MAEEHPENRDPKGGCQDGNHELVCSPVAIMQMIILSTE
jgi:hypothetical protein